MEPTRDLDIFDMPFEGLAAYWLSLKKLFDVRKLKTILGSEIEHTREPFIRLLLSMGFGDMEPAGVRRLAEAKRDLILHRCGQKLDVMRQALYAVALAENPRVTIVRMNSLFPTPPMEEQGAFDMAGALTDTVRQSGADLPALLGVDHKLSPDRLLVKLLFYVIQARRSGKQSLSRYVEHSSSPYFREGLSLAVDGFDADFLSQHLQSIRNEILLEAERKMDMSIELCLLIPTKLTYADLRNAAGAFME